MKQAALFFALVTLQLSWSQKTDRHFFSWSDAQLSQVLTAIEQKFEVRYSYADSVVASESITLPYQKYTLRQLHEAIEIQGLLKVDKINDRYYSVGKNRKDTIHAEQLQEIAVAGFLSKGIDKFGQKFVISPQKVEELPGVTDADILLSIQQLPGVKSPNETASGLHIRGGTPDQNLVLWDGIRMYHPGHLFGMISGFNPNVAQTVNYYNKGTNPKFGERISGTIDMKTTDKIADELKADAGINALNADLYVRAPILKDKIGLQLSGRKSITEWWQSPTFDALAEKVFQHTNFDDFEEDNQLRFQDYSAKLNLRANNNNDFYVTGIVIDNHLNFNSTDADGDDKTQKMNIRNFGSSGNWNRRYNARLSHKVLLYHSAYTFDYEKNEQNAPQKFERFTKLNRVTDSGLETNFNWIVNGSMTTEFGYQLSGNDLSHSFTSKTQDLEIELDQKQFFNLTHSGFANVRYAPGTWDFQAGVRYSHFSKLKENSFEPRIFIRKDLTEKFAWQFSYERKSQITGQIREAVINDLSLENYVWILSDNKDYPIQRANQFSSGLTYKTKGILLDVDAYYKTIDGITSLSFGFLHQYDSFIHQGKGFTKGIDILIQKNAPTWRAWMTYTYQDSQNKYENLNGGQYFPINSDTKHAFSVSLYKKWGNYSLASGWFWHTGKPYSQLDASNEIVAFNNQRLPDYHRLNISGTYQFQQHAWKGKVGFSVYNLYNRHAVISKEFEREYDNIGAVISSKYQVQDYYALGFMPNVFFRASF